VAERSARRSPRDHPETALQLVGATIRALRQRRGLRQIDVATATGLRRTSISEIEQGKRNVTLRNLLHLATVLQVPPSQLLQPLDGRADLLPSGPAPPS
jgi:transcriptional regulator with XRE-family HTH domain